MQNAYTQNILNTIFTTSGEALLNSKMPDEFELYLFALQVVSDSENKIIDYLIFPVNPSSVMQIQKSFTNVKKTFNAIHVNENNTFSPNPISMSGNFGRGFKFVMTGRQSVPLKTGYGVVKYLSNLISLSKQNSPDGKPYRTILYNLAFGDVTTVEIIDCKFTQTQQETRIWNYDLNMVAVAPGNIGTVNFNYGLNNIFAINFMTKVFNKHLQLMNF